MSRSMRKFTLLCAGLSLTNIASATTWDWGPVTTRIDNKLSAGAAWRLEDRAPDLIGIANGGTAFYVNADDGDLAWDKGDIVTAPLKLTSDLTVTWGEFGLFARGNGVYNPVLERKELFDRADYAPSPHRTASLEERDHQTHDVRSHDGHNVTLLDGYAFGNFRLGDRAATVKVGKQTINWGEALLIQNGINSIVSYDANRLHTPGAELEEFILGVPQVWASVDLISHVSAEFFYQLGWQRSIPDAVGTFWSTNDSVPIGGVEGDIDSGRAGENADATAPCAAPPVAGLQCVPFGGAIPRGADRTPRKSGQFGVAVKSTLPIFNEVDIGFYATRYHSRLPLVSATSRASGGDTPAATGNYFIEYPEAIQMYGFSFNTNLPFGGIAMQGEYSFKHDQPLQIDDVEVTLAELGAPSQISPVPGATLGGQYIQGFRRKNVSQMDVSFTKLFGPSGWLHNDDLAMFLEMGADYVHALEDPSVLRYDAPATDLPGDATTAASQGLPQQMGGYPTRWSWGYKAVARVTYNNVFGILQLEPTLLWEQDIKGITPTPLLNFIEGRRAFTPALIARYGSNWSTEMSYTNYFGAGAKNLLRDRDVVQLSVKYSF